MGAVAVAVAVTVAAAALRMSAAVTHPVCAMTPATTWLAWSAGVARSPGSSRSGRAPVCLVRVVRSFPHDAGAFTEGLAFADGTLIEGTGLAGRSEVRRVELRTGAVDRHVPLASRDFGEGVTVLGGYVYELTWRSRLAFVYDLTDLREVARLGYPWEGWGLATDGRSLIASDGTAVLRFLNPRSLTLSRQVTVEDDGRQVTRLNELEYVNGLVFANVWGSDRIAVLDPASGRVVAWLDLRDLPETHARRVPDAEPNGIAVDGATGRLFVTGKLWPRIYEVTITPPG